MTAVMTWEEMSPSPGCSGPPKNRSLVTSSLVKRARSPPFANGRRSPLRRLRSALPTCSGIGQVGQRGHPDRASLDLDLLVAEAVQPRADVCLDLAGPHNGGMPLLRIVEGDGAGFALELTSKRIAIGRDVGNTIQIGDPKASRFHVEIVQDHGRYRLRDLGSSNGTWNESGRIAEVEIRAGSTFRIGSTHFLFEDRVKPREGGLDATLVADGEEPYEGGRFRTLKQDSRFFEVAPDADRAVLARVNKYLMLLHDLIRRSGTAEDREALFELLDDVAADALEGDTRCAVFLPTESGWTL